MSRLLALAVLGVAVTVGTESEWRREVAPAGAAEVLPAPPEPASKVTPARSPEGPSFLVKLSLTHEGKTLSAPTVAVTADEPATVQTGSERPFVVGIDKDGKDIVRILKEGWQQVDLTVTECRDGVVTLDATVTMSQIEEVGKKGAVQTVRLGTKQLRIVEPALLGETIRVKGAERYEVTAVVEELEE